MGNQPATPTQELAARGTASLLIATPSFTGEHIENLHEIDIELRRDLTEEGLEDVRFTRVRSPPDASAYYDALATMAENFTSYEVVRPGHLVDDAEQIVRRIMDRD